jgi:hypothetical protein
MEKEKVLSLLKKVISFGEGIQKKIGRDRATVYSVYLLEQEGVEPTFQRICLIAHKVFPESFSFSEFPEFLDSRIIRNCLWHCTHKTKGWLTGSDKTHYSTTEKGKNEIALFSKLNNPGDIDNLPMRLKLRKRDLVTKPKDKEINYLEDIKHSKAFINFTKNNIKDISLLDIKVSLGGDRYSPQIYFENKMKTMLDLSKFYKETELFNYLKWIKENWGIR